MDNSPNRRRNSPSSFIYTSRPSVQPADGVVDAQAQYDGPHRTSTAPPSQVIPAEREQGNLGDHDRSSVPFMQRVNSDFTLFSGCRFGYHACGPGSAVPSSMDEDFIYLSSGPSGRQGFEYCSPVPMSTDSVSETVYPSSDSNTEVKSRPSVVSEICGGQSRHVSTVRQIHKICLEASRVYLEERLVNSRLRGRDAFHDLCQQQDTSDDEQPSCSGPSRRRHRWSPYSREQHVRRRANGLDYHRTEGSTATTAAPTDSLLANISIICSGLWSQSQRDRLHVPNTERVAVANMTHLLEWAETIVLGDAEAMADEPLDVNRVLTAGKNLCAWLGDVDGRGEIEVLSLARD